MSIIETHETLSPVERYQLLKTEARQAAEKEQAARDEAIQQLRHEIDERVALLNQCGFNYSLMEREESPATAPPTEIEPATVQTKPLELTAKGAKVAAMAKARAALAKKRAQEKAPAKKGASPFQAGTQYDWIYMQIARNGKPVSVTDILRSAATSEFQGLAEVPNRLTVALNGMMSRGAIERVGEKLYAVKK